ncbi:MFS transporter [Gordonibacter sp. 28C]|uniref:MFS transporter n=1 Tax=Gordonibacter sp. 28C TaxID=2078569 RepID=UPI0013146E94|nr:MFS transporter [Gordonibacter sp. 28C]
MEDSRLNSKKSWAVTAIVCLCFFVVETSEQRVPPILPILSENMGLSVVDGGWLMSALGWASLLAALPAAWLLTKIKPKLTMALAVALPLVSGILGGVTESFAVLCFARVLSGAGIGILGVICAFIIDEWFTPDKRGLPTAIMVCMYPIACFFMLNVSPLLTESFSWHAVWWLGAVLSAITLVVVFARLSNKRPYTESHTAKLKESNETAEKVSVKKLVKTPSLWCVLVAFLCFDITFYGLTTYMPTALVETYGATLDFSTLIVSLLSAVMIPAIVLNGVLLNKVGIKNRKYLPAIGLAGLGFGAALAFFAPSLMVAALAMVVAGFFVGFISSSLFTIGPDTIPRPVYIGIVVALVTLFQNAGIAVGPLVIGTVVEAAGNVWSAAGLPCLIIGLLGALCCLLINNKEAAAIEKKEKVAKTK